MHNIHVDASNRFFIVLIIWKDIRVLLDQTDNKGEKSLAHAAMLLLNL